MCFRYYSSAVRDRVGNVVGVEVMVILGWNRDVYMRTQVGKAETRKIKEMLCICKERRLYRSKAKYPWGT